MTETAIGSRLWALRCRLALTQREFADRFALPLGVVQDTEQGRSQPVQAMRVLLAAIDANPDGVASAADAAW